MSVGVNSYNDAIRFMFSDDLGLSVGPSTQGSVCPADFLH